MVWSLIVDSALGKAGSFIKPFLQDWLWRILYVLLFLFFWIPYNFTNVLYLTCSNSILTVKLFLYIKSLFLFSLLALSDWKTRKCSFINHKVFFFKYYGVHIGVLMLDGMWHLRLSQQSLWEFLSSGMWCYVV